MTPIIFAASITLGEMLVAERRFLYYALAPILYNLGIVGGTLLLHAGSGSGGGRRGRDRRLAAPGHPGGRHPAHDRAHPARAWTCGCPPCASSCGLMLPKMISHPIEPLTFLFFTARRDHPRAGSVRPCRSRATSRACRWR